MLDGDSTSHTNHFYELRKRFHKSDDDDSENYEIEECARRADGAFAASYPIISKTPTIVFAGNSAGLLHIADHLDGMADVEYEPYNPKWSENSEHYHSWIDGKKDVRSRPQISYRIFDFRLGIIS